MVMMSAKEASTLWGISTRRVTTLCSAGKIPGASKENGSWQIPANAEKPADARVRTGAYKKSAMPAHLPLPVGISDYRLASTEYYYVDKTLMIKDFLEQRPMVSLFTRPRRFGKTLNMDMLRVFFEKTEEDTSKYFTNKAIWACGQKYRDYQGKYPVIFMTFKDVKRNTWEETYAHLTRLIGEEYLRHADLADSPACNDFEKAVYQRIVSSTADSTDYISSLKTLSSMLHKHYNCPAVIIIDEYDTPIQQGHLMGFYDDAVSFMRGLFSGGLKDNRSLAFGFLTGILRVAKESIFSGLNNLVVNSVLDKKYNTYFGFTADEVAKMAAYYGASDKLNELRDWYDGYRFGDAEIYNPWSVINYFSAGCEARPYWLSTSNNDVISEVLEQADKDIYTQLTDLLQGKTVATYVDTSVIYPQLQNNPSSIYSFLLVSGYLKVVKAETSISGDYLCHVALPNREITYVYNKEILSHLNVMMPQTTVVAIQEALYSGDESKLQQQIQTLLTQSVSSFDTAGENFYHGFVLGLCALLGNAYATSNRESGDGRYDIQLAPKTPTMPGIIIELKAEKHCDTEQLQKLSQTALNQIEDKKYDTEMLTHGVKSIYKYGVAFSGKNVEVAFKK